MMKQWRAFWLLLGLTLCAAAFAEEQSVNPGINAHYQNPDFQQWVERFEREGREVYDKREAIVAASGVATGQRVADIGAGTGLFTRLFARQVGAAGKVYAVDISETFIDNIRRQAQQAGLNNIETIVNSGRDTGLPANTLDLVFICDTYHHFEYPQSMLSSIHTAMKPGARLVVIDFVKDPAVSSAWVMNHVRADKQTVIREIEQAGFRLHAEPDLLSQNYYLIFTRLPAVAP